MSTRTQAFAQEGALTVVDRFGIYLSVRQTQRWVPSITGQVVGDFGCGYHARLLASRLDEVERAYLVDVSLSPVVATHQRVTAIEGLLPAAMARVPTEALDAAFCLSVLEHLSEPVEMLRELHRVLKPGARLLLNVPSWRGKTFLELSAFKLGLSPAAEMDDHKTYYDVRDLWPLLVGAGFRPSRIRCWSHKFGLNTFAVCDKDPA